jgi:putative endonuclease
LLFLYIIECQNNTLYTGITANLEQRWRLHLAGKAAKYTRSFPPKRLAMYWKLNADRPLGLSIESRLKKLSREQKLTLIKKPRQLNHCLDLDPPVEILSHSA